MKILITGATGLIGSSLSKLLREKGHFVHYLTTSMDKITNSPNYQGFYWNPEKRKIDENCLNGVDVIIHLAGANLAKRWTSSYKKEIIESRTQTGDLLFNLIQNKPNQVKQFISASGTAIYPETFSEVLDETSQKIEDSFLSDVVQQWEQSADRFRSLGLKVCKLRTGMVLSNRGGALPEMARPIKFGFGAAIGSGRQTVSWIHIRDLTEMYAFVAEHQLEGVYNAVSPQSVTNAQLTQTMAKVLKKPLFLPHIPEFVLKLLLGEMAYLLVSGQNLSPQKIIDAGFEFRFTAIDKAIEDLYP